MAERSFTRTISEFEHGSGTNKKVRSCLSHVSVGGILTLLMARTLFKGRLFAMVSLAGRFPAATSEMLGAAVEHSAGWNEADEVQ